MQTWPVGQEFPQRPQFSRSVGSDTQAEPHTVCPDGHELAHDPAVHTCPAAHARPQAPQLALSELSVAQVEPQSICPIGHEPAQAPITQT